MLDLRELYQQIILDHNKSPRNFRALADADRSAEGYNPLCGDHVNVYLKLKDDRIEEITFQGSGCAISKASASLMTSLLKRQSVEEAEALFGKFHDLVAGDDDSAPDLDEMGKLAVFSGVRAFPTRIKCATLAWHTLKAALHGNGAPATTE